MNEIGDKIDGNGDKIESKIEGKRPWVIIGTSGSTDYLKDTTGDRCYWSVYVQADDDV